MDAIRTLHKDKLNVRIYNTEEDMGRASAAYAASVLKDLGREKNEINVLFSTARSQEEMFRALEGTPGVPWEKINVFQVDEYIGFGPDEDRLLRRQLMDNFFKSVNFRGAYFMDSMAEDLEAECRRYEALIKSRPIDVSFVGIGDNGHLAFNEPDTADFNDPVFVKRIVIDETSKNQLVNHKNFESAADMPDCAFTVTLPALMSAKTVICTTPFATKARAVRDALEKEIGAARPASIMRTHPNATVFLDRDSASLL